MKFRLTNIAIVATLCMAVLSCHAYTPLPKRYDRLGGDISMLPALQKHGVQYCDSTGTVVDPYDLFASEAWNMMRVRLFVDPANASTEHHDEGVCQDLPYVTDLCRTIHNRGFEIMLDFHYSDTWADPGKQFTPARWQHCQNVDELADSVYAYTRYCLTTLKNTGIEPEMIQVGNEITNGMLWPTAHVDPTGDENWDNLIALLKAGVRACREVVPSARLIIHTEKAGSWPVTKAYYDKLDAASVDYDVIGLSYYPMWHGTIANLGATLDSIGARYPKREVMIVEAAYYYQHDGKSWGGDEDFSQCPPGTIAGQQQFTRELVDELLKHFNVKGLFWWYPEENRYGDERHPRWGLNRGLFDCETGRCLPALHEMRRFARW